MKANNHEANAYFSSFSCLGPEMDFWTSCPVSSLEVYNFKCVFLNTSRFLNIIQLN